MKLGKRLNEIRIMHKMTQEELAEKYHVTRQTISNWENGKSYPDLETLVKISDDFDVSLDILLKGDVDMINEITKEQKQGKAFIKKMVFIVLGVIVVFVLINSFIGIPSIVLF